MQLTDLDIAILRIVNGNFSPYVSLFFVFANYFLYALVFILVLNLWATKQKKKMIHLLFVLALGLLLVYSLKYLINRPRPYETFPDINAGINKGDPSFPSAHVFTSFLCLYFLPKRPKTIKILAITYLVFLIPIGSLYIGIHYPSDVLIAAILGSLFPILLPEKTVLGQFKKHHIFNISL